jgi:hypothetical protein
MADGSLRQWLLLASAWVFAIEVAQDEPQILEVQASA